MFSRVTKEITLDQEPMNTADAASVAAEAPEGAPVPSAAPTDYASPETTEAPQVNWDSEENPHYARARQLQAEAERAARLAQENEAFRQQFAQAARLAEEQRRARHQQDFEEGRIDSAEFARRMAAEIAQRDQWWQQQMTPYLARDWADVVAQKYGLSSEERQELYGLDGHAMDFAAQQIVQRRNLVPVTKVAELEKKLEQLQRSIAAQQVTASGVSQTLGANPSGVGPEPKTDAERLRAFLNARYPEGLMPRRAG